MKATSTLISVVLILAMCLSLFTVSAFAEPGTTIVIGGPVESAIGGGYTVEGTYVGSGADEVEVIEAAPAAAAAVQAPADSAVSDAASLVAAAARGGDIKLAGNITLSESLVFGAASVLDLNGYALTFANGGAAKDAAIVGNGSVRVKSGSIAVSGSVDAQGNATGFKSAASGVTLDNVNVSFNAPDSWNIFSQVGLIYGSYNRDVSAYINTEAYEVVNQNGAFIVRDKVAAEEIIEAVAEPAIEAPAEEPPVQEEPVDQGEPADDVTEDIVDVLGTEENVASVLTEEPAGEPENENGEPVEGTEPEEGEAADGAGNEAVVETEEPAGEPENENGEPVEGTEPEEGEAADGAGNEAGVETEEPAEEQPGEVGDSEIPEADQQQPEENEGEEPAEEQPGEVGDSEIPESDEQLAEENVDDMPVDETPVDVVEEEEKTYEEEVRVSEEEEASQEGVVTLTGTDEVTGAVVIVSGKNLPEGLTVVVKPLSKDMLGGLEEGERALLALDISLIDADGNEYEPKDDPNVGAVSVQIQHESLGNLAEDESLNLYHVVDEDVKTVGSAEQVADNTLNFATGSFSPFVITAKTGPGTVYTGSDGEAHKKVITIKNTSGEIYMKDSGSNLTFEISGGACPESISIIDPDNVSSGNADVYKAGYLIYGTDYNFGSYNPASGNPVPDPLTVNIKADAIKSAPTGKWAVVFWFKDTTDSGSTRVYMVQYVTIVPKAEIKAISPVNENGDFYFEKCDYEPVQIYITADLEGFYITNKSTGKTVVYYDYYYDSKKVYVNTSKYPNKSYSASEMFTVGDYVATDAVGHDFVAGKTLQLNKSLIEKLDFGEYTITVTQMNRNTTPDYKLTKTFNMTIVPGISVADGLNDYIKGKNVWIKFIACAPIDYDADGTLAIWIGGQKISHEYYSISNDHQTLWIYRNLLDQLRSNNSYTLTARLWKYNSDGSKETYYPATAQFNILAAGSTSYKSPKTGDNSNVALWAAVLVLSGGAVVALIPKKRKVSK